MRKPPISGIYCFHNEINQKRYIGSSKDIVDRYRRHLCMIKRKVHVNAHFQSAINKYGLCNFGFIILEECSHENLISREQFYIDSYPWKMLYNKTKFANGGGSDVTEKPVTLIDLKGNIVQEFRSGCDLARFIGARDISYHHINTGSITRTKYRMVTPEFFENNQEEILSWKPYSNKLIYDKEHAVPKKITYYEVMDHEKTVTCSYSKEIGAAMNITAERARQLIKSMTNKGISVLYHPQTRKTIRILKGD